MKKWLNKYLFIPILKLNNKRLWRQRANQQFLESLCIENYTLDLDKYLRLMKMVKRKYKK